MQSPFIPRQKLFVSGNPKDVCFYIGSVECEVGTLHVVRMLDAGNWNHTQGYMLFEEHELALPAEQ